MLRYEGAVAMIADARERAKGEVAGAGFAVGHAAPRLSVPPGPLRAGCPAGMGAAMSEATERGDSRRRGAPKARLRSRAIV